MMALTYRMRRKNILRFTLLIISVAGALAWWLGTSATVEDDTPLPQGAVNRPIGFGRALASRLFLNVRLDLDTLEKGIKTAIPPYQKFTNEDPKVDATLRVPEFDLYRVGSERLGVKAKLDVDGGVKWGIFTVKDMTLTAKGDLALSLSSAWEWQVAPKLTVTFDKVDARPGLPDWLAKGVLNLASSWFLPDFVKNITKNLPPPKPLVQDLWNQSRQRITVLGAPHIEVSSEPVGVLLRQPVLDEATNDLDLGLGVEVRLLADVSAAPTVKAVLATNSELPAITTVDGSIRDTTLLLPLMLELGEVERHFQTQNIPWDDGSVEVSRVELRDKDGTLNVRIRFAAKLPSTYATPVLRRLSGTLSFHVKPGCDPTTGKLKFESFDFTQATDSRLVNVIGYAARESLKNHIQTELPAQLDTLLRDVQINAQTEANRVLIQQRDALATASPQFANLLRAAKMEVTDLRVRPYALLVREGYLLCVLRVNANLGITLE
ncbi:MAG TPA: hypothetical protein DDZ88_29310 [Verrucomicrobiales bacterium]|nr:hypothetical protein [Verrucomicrobiales bacterium]